MRKLTILVLTRGGLEKARCIARAWQGESLVYAPSCQVGQCSGGEEESGGYPIFASAEPGVWGWRGPLRIALPEIWSRAEAIVAIMALGIVVRLIAPLARDKRTDPAVVVVDEAGRFAISVLGGHQADANAIAIRLSEILKCTPVVTTAGDALGLPAIDTIGRDLGWKIEPQANLNRVAGAVVRGQPIGILQDAGEPLQFDPWPDSFLRIEKWEDVDEKKIRALLVISDRVYKNVFQHEWIVFYRPPTLAVGVGCRRGVSKATILEWLDRVCAEAEVSTSSLSTVATVTLKADEPGLLEACRERALPLSVFTPEQLTGHPGILTPSERVRAKIGIEAVAEPAALVAAGAQRLLVPKRIGPGVTVALARRPQPIYHA